MKLTHKISIYVPSTIEVNTKIDNSEQVEKTLVFLSGLFGGATSYNARGAWLSSSAGLVLENVTICYAFTDRRGKRLNRTAVLDYAAKLRDDMKQDAISVEIDGRLQFV